MNDRSSITEKLLKMIRLNGCEEEYVDVVYDAIDMLNAHAIDPEDDEPCIKLKDVYKFPIRRDHHDSINGNDNFINGIETVIEYINLLPRYIGKNN